MEPESTPRTITVEQAIAMAMGLAREGRIGEAAAVCRAVLELDPNQPDALHYAGVLAHQQGRGDDAIALIERSLALVPQQADWHSNLGIVLQEQGRLDDAMAAFRRAIALNRSHANAHNNLGVLLRALGRLEDAEAEYQAVLALEPNHPDVHLNLGRIYQRTGRTREALLAYCRAITLRPSHPIARRHLAMAYEELGERDKAVEACEDWLRHRPDDPRARHALAAHSGRDVPVRAPDAWVETVFDEFADDFDAKLSRLDYRAPELIARAVAAAVGAPSGALDVFDMGCGTGLCGALLAPYARRLVGVDLSTRMLAHARGKQVYGELVHAELTAYLRRHVGAADIIVSADTVTYFGPLDDVFATAFVALRPGGSLVFTVEEMAGHEEGAGHRLEPHGRYTHARDYVAQRLAANGFIATIERADLRMESTRPVPGLVVRALKMAAHA